jgi:hypothetical protein
MAFTHPFLEQPAPGWKHDLPGPNEPPSSTPYPAILSNPPNHVDNIYLELPRSTLMVRGLCIWMAISLFLISTFSVCIFIFFLIEDGTSPSFLPASAILIGFVAGLWGGVYFWRIDTEAPRDEPIRFNRIRRKVYVYRFHHDGLRPFDRRTWGVHPAVYNWDDLHAEACRLYVPGTALVENITISVRKPGTKEVLDRFQFSCDIQQGEMYWAMAQLFMQQGPQSLPIFPRPPRDWNNERLVFNLARYLAPKVQWPQDMELESRTAL